MKWRGTNATWQASSSAVSASVRASTICCTLYVDVLPSGLMARACAVVKRNPPTTSVVVCRIPSAVVHVTVSTSTRSLLATLSV